VGQFRRNWLDGLFWILRVAEQPVASLKRWVLVGLVACLALALAYLPPRGAESSGKSIFVSQSLQGTPARQRAQALADEWRNADAAVRLLEDRQRVSRDSLRASPTIVFHGPTLPPNAVHNVETVMDSVWRDLGLGETKVRVTLVLELQRPYGSADTPTPLQDRVAYLAPDSAHRTTCMAYLPAGPYWTLFIQGKRHEGFGRFSQWLEAGLGPCAFYAAYGTPGRSVESWLAARHWDVGLYLGSHGIAGQRFSSLNLIGNPSSPWYWEAVYSFPPATVACLAGRPSGCRAAVLAGAAEARTIPIPNVVLVERRWWRVQHLLPGERYLGDVARTLGRDRFLDFWTSGQPVDTALAAALKQPVGEWTADWERGFVQPIRLGPAAPLGGVAIALAITVFAIVVVAGTASRRQVR
jgi:hypothetical protein